MDIEHEGDGIAEDSKLEERATAETNRSTALPVVDLPLLALQDACLDGADAARTETRPIPSSTARFASVLRTVLLQPDPNSADIIQASWQEGSRVSKLMSDKQVFRILNGLLSADEVLARAPKKPDSRSTITSEGLSAEATRDKLEGRTAFEHDEDLSGGINVNPSGSEGSSAALVESGDEVDVRILSAMLTQAPRRVCQYAFRKNDIVWICKVCQADETCVLCNACFRSSDHLGHEVYFYHAQVSSKLGAGVCISEVDE